MTNEEIKKIIDLVKENNQKNNAEIVVSLLAIGLKLERLEALEKENQELKEQRLSLSLQLQDYRLIKEITLPNVLEENEKLKKAIEILKDKVSFEIILNLCDEEEKEALKEVLGE